MTLIYRLLILIVAVGAIRAIMKEDNVSQKVAFAMVLPPLLLRFFMLR